MFSIYSFSERQLLNNKYRYEGIFYGVRYAIDSVVKKSKSDIENFLESVSIDFLVNNEGYVIDLWYPSKKG